LELQGVTAVIKMQLKGMSDECQNQLIYLPTKSPHKNLSCVMQKLPDKIAWFCRPRQSMFYLRRFSWPTFCISDNKFCFIAMV